ncbi:MAG: hypothetical protein CGW95_02590 [Phenylobacterium zucineum]|nr:MAG: hypothetical protein CGW95_02590 [Phenylobacterium zucineum]
MTPPASWPATYVARLEAWSQVTQLNADLLSHDSATATLQAWCDLHGGGRRVAAHRVRGQDRAAGPEDRAALGLAPDEPLTYRRVQLTCGDLVLSEADNWYRPALLTPEMNRMLEDTETPFGVVVQPLNFHRKTLSTSYLFRPLLLNWEEAPPSVMAGPGGFQPPKAVLRHRAVLLNGEGTAFSLVVETYTDAILVRRNPFP